MKNTLIGIPILTLDLLQIIRKEGGEATGEGYVKFSRQDEATAALERHMQKIGHRYFKYFGILCLYFGFSLFVVNSFIWCGGIFGESWNSVDTEDTLRDHYIKKIGVFWR